MNNQDQTAFLKNKDLISELICRQELLNKVEKNKFHLEVYDIVPDHEIPFGNGGNEEPQPESMECPVMPVLDAAPGRKIERMTVEVFKPVIADQTPEPMKLGLPMMPYLEKKPKNVTKSRLSLKPSLVRLIVMKKKIDKPKVDDGRWIKREDCPKLYHKGTVAQFKHEEHELPPPTKAQMNFMNKSYAQ
jgi:hypothetical protein